MAICVLYEMLTGAAPFSGPTASDIIAAILKSEPEWKALPADTPRSIERLLRRCLMKDQALRLRDLGGGRVVARHVRADAHLCRLARRIQSAGFKQRRAPTPFEQQWEGTLLSIGWAIEAVDVKTADVRFDAGEPKSLFELPEWDGAGRWRYDVSPDGQRFLVGEADRGGTPTMSLIINWPGLLGR